MTHTRINFQVEPSQNVCDFCSQPSPAWRYPCATFDSFVVETDTQTVTGTPVGDWLACEPCHDLIERDDRVALVDRAVATPKTFSGIEVPEDIARTFTRELHEGFFAHRTGEAVRL